MGQLTSSAAARSAADIVLRHGIAAIGVALIVATLAFVTVQSMPYDLAMRVAEARHGEGFTQASANEIRKTAGLDAPILTQYARWLGSIAAGQFGRSTVSNQPVIDELRRSIGPTITVGGTALAIALLLSLLIGFFAGINEGGWFDRLSVGLAAALSSVPSFLVGLGLITIFAIKLQWLPAAGKAMPSYFVLPALTLAIVLVPDLSRTARNAVVRTMRDFYVTYARVKGQPWPRVILVHALRPTLVPVVGYCGPMVANTIGGIIVIEILFNLGGIGSTLVDALLDADIPLALGAGLVIGVAVVAVNALADVAVRLLDPRTAATPA